MKIVSKSAKRIQSSLGRLDELADLKAKILKRLVNLGRLHVESP